MVVGSANYVGAMIAARSSLATCKHPAWKRKAMFECNTIAKLLYRTMLNKVTLCILLLTIQL